MKELRKDNPIVEIIGGESLVENIGEPPIETTTEEENTQQHNIDRSITSIIEGRNTWSYEHTLSLINAVTEHYEEMHDIRRRKHFWSVINELLKSQGLQYTDIACKKKWENLLRTYKSVKDLRNKSGRGSTKFVYFNQLDELLGDNPTNASPHSIDVSKISDQARGETSSAASDSLTNSVEDSPVEQQGKKRRANPTTEYVKYKKRYYEKKENLLSEAKRDKQEKMEKFLELQKEKINLMKQRNEIELRKAEALEKMIDH